MTVLALQKVGMPTPPGPGLGGNTTFKLYAGSLETRAQMHFQHHLETVPIYNKRRVLIIVGE